MRIITFVGAASIVYTEWQVYKANFTGYMIIFFIIAILFNPLVPIYFTKRSIWVPIDIFSGFTFLSYAFYPKENIKNIIEQVKKSALHFLLKKTDKRSKTIKKTKSLLTKIVLTIVVLIIGTIFQAGLSESRLTHTAGVRLIPGMIIGLGIILVWIKKNKNKT